MFYEAGMYTVGMSGILPLSWQELESWLRLSGRELNWFEIRTIREMSNSYCIEYGKASKPNAVPPYTLPVVMTPERQKEINDELKRSMEAFMAANNKR